MKPMLAIEHDPKKLKYPIYASPKLDGLRGLIHDGNLLSRSLKMIPNKYVQKILGHSMWNGFDGELIAGSPTDPNCMQNCTSFFMAHDKVSTEWTYYVFDLHDSDMGFDVRFSDLHQRIGSEGLGLHVRLLPQKTIKNEDELAEYEAECLAAGYEGLILRKIDGTYKYGRSTVNEGLLLKVKRFVDSEAQIIGFEEEMENTNAKQVNELGRSKRSSHQAGKVGKDTLGAFLVRDLTSGVEFSVGTGLTDALAAEVWRKRPTYLGRVLTYKSFPVGVKDLPRHPVFKAFRDVRDMS